MLSADGGTDYLPRLIHHFAEQPDIDLLVSEDAGHVHGVGEPLGGAITRAAARSDEVQHCPALTAWTVMGPLAVCFMTEQGSPEAVVLFASLLTKAQC